MFAIIATLVIATLSVSGCVGLTSAGTPAKTPPSGATSGVLAASSTSLNFGSVAPGSKSSQTLTLTNTGAAAVMISQAAVFGSGFSVVGTMSPVSVAPGKNQAIKVEFAPMTPGNSNGSLVVSSDASDSSLTLSLVGSAVVGPSITTQPASQSVTVGQTATFDVVATGSGALSYQWKRNGGAISGATFATYSTPATTIADNGASFSVVITDTAGSTSSNSATLMVAATAVAPSITSQPASQTVIPGQTATFSVSANGTAPLAYQWMKNGTLISGARSATYTTPPTNVSDNAASFTVTVSNSKGTLVSDAAILTVSVPPAITAQPFSQSVTVGQSATFAVTASGAAPLTYQWKKGGMAIAGANSTSYTTPAVTNSDNGASFSVTVSDAVGSVTSNAATLTVTAAPVAPSIATQPASQTVTAGQSATFAVTASGSATLTYQWMKNGTPIGGAISASYTTPATSASDSGSQFAVTVTNGTGSATSGAATLTVNAATLLLNVSTTSLTFASVNLGANSSLGATFTNAGNSNVTVSSVTIAGAGFAASGISTGQILTPGQSATLNVTFTPAAAGTVPGSVTVASNATNSPATLTLSGTGVQAISHSATLNWAASTSTVAGYNIYRSDVSGGPYTKINTQLIPSSQYADSTVVAGQTYFYVVTSQDSSGVESAFSNEASAAVPTP